MLNFDRGSVAYAQLFDNGLGTEDGSRLESQHRLGALFNLSVSYEARQPQYGFTYVEVSKSFAVGIERVVVEIDELLCRSVLATRKGTYLLARG